MVIAKQGAHIQFAASRAYIAAKNDRVTCNQKQFSTEMASRDSFYLLQVLRAHLFLEWRHIPILYIHTDEQDKEGNADATDVNDHMEKHPWPDSWQKGQKKTQLKNVRQ